VVSDFRILRCPPNVLAGEHISGRRQRRDGPCLWGSGRITAASCRACRRPPTGRLPGIPTAMLSDTGSRGGVARFWCGCGLVLRPGSYPGSRFGEPVFVVLGGGDVPRNRPARRKNPRR